MQKLSVLIFSRNNAKNTISLVKDIYKIADEIVLIDSSDSKERTFLLREKRKSKLSKLNIYYVVALGYPDPLRTYALKLCRYDWVLLIDTDERLSESLKEKVKSIIGGTKAPACSIKRYEEVLDNKLTTFYTWQTRLFKKSMVTFKGLVHEQPKITGDVQQLDSAYYMLHFAHSMDRTPWFEYGADFWSDYPKIEKYNRMSYAIFERRMGSYASRVPILKLVHWVMKALHYFRNPEKEVSHLDYAIYNSVRDLPYLRGHPTKILYLFGQERVYVKRIKDFQSQPDADEAFEISKLIDKFGMTKYLGLDDEKTIRSLNKTYKNKKQGIALLAKLIKKEYEGFRLAK